MIKKKPRVLLIGGLPRPSGGVTVFLGRLVNQIGSDVDFHVLDIHAGEKEPTAARSLKIAPRNRWLKVLWMVWQITKFRGDIVHFNYSGCHALMALALLPKFGRRFFVTLHNGSQLKILDGLAPWKASLVLKGSAKIDCAFSLCDDHATLYSQLGVSDAKVIHTKSQIPAPKVKPAFVDEKHRQLRDRYRHLVVSSGHVSRTYNFEYLVRFVNEHPDCAGMLFFYGEHMDQGYLSELQQRMVDPDRFVIYFHQSEAVFLAALATSDAYLRPTHVDSWGMAVADAISLGVPAIASNVCQRAAGAILCSITDFGAFSKSVDKIICERRKPTHHNEPSAAHQHLSKYLGS